METVPSQKFVVLIRCSTKTQHTSGHGLNAQRRDIDLYLQQLEKHQVVAEFVEVESGAAASRPVLDQAITTCKKHNAALLVSKVDRASRDLETLARIVKTVPIRVASLPQADPFQIHLYGALAQQEREFISTRTRAALAAAKARGVRLGNPNIAQMNRDRKNAARTFADKHAPLVTALRSEGKTLRQICSILNSAGIRTAQGAAFNPVQVHRILKRGVVST